MDSLPTNPYRAILRNAHVKSTRVWLRQRWRGRQRGVWIALGIPLVGAFALAYFAYAPALPLTIASISPPAGTHFDFTGNDPSTAAISPDGRTIVFSARGAGGFSQLWLRPLDSPTAHPLLGTTGAVFPFWSPDSKFVAFFRQGRDSQAYPTGPTSMSNPGRTDVWGLMKVAIYGGPVIGIADAPDGFGGSWSAKGVILFAPSPHSPLMQVSERGGVVRHATQVDRATLGHAFPSFLPDGHHFLYEALVTDHLRLHLMVGDLDSNDTHDLGQVDSNAVYSGGYLLSLRDGVLQAEPFSTRSLSTTGDGLLVAENVAALLGQYQVAPISVSTNGVLLYTSVPDAEPLRLTAFDRAGNRIAKVDSAHPNGPSTDRFARGFRSLTSERPDVPEPLSNREALIQATSPNDDPPTGPLEIALPSRLLGGVTRDWSPDGKYMLLSPSNPSARAGVWTVSLDDRSSPTPFLDTAAKERQPRFSPDGHWVAYTANVEEAHTSGQNRSTPPREDPQIFVASFPTPSIHYQVSTDGGERPRWRADGKELFFQTVSTTSGRLMAAEITYKNGSLQIGEATSQDITISTGRSVPYEVSRDGQRILVSSTPESVTQTPLTIVWNWSELLKSKRPVPDNSFPLTDSADKPISFDKESQR